MFLNVLLIHLSQGNLYKNLYNIKNVLQVFWRQSWIRNQNQSKSDTVLFLQSYMLHNNIHLNNL